MTERCADPCHVNGHFLRIAFPDGSMYFTRHVGVETLDRLAGEAGPVEVAAYREIGAAALLANGPRDGVYVITPPEAALVSAASAVEIRGGEARF